MLDMTTRRFYNSDMTIGIIFSEDGEESYRESCWIKNNGEWHNIQVTKGLNLENALKYIGRVIEAGFKEMAD